MIETIGNGWMWAGFVAFIGVMVAIDMLLLGRQGAHRVSAREAGAWSVVWIGLALAFNEDLYGDAAQLMSPGVEVRWPSVRDGFGRGYWIGCTQQVRAVLHDAKLRIDHWAARPLPHDDIAVAIRWSLVGRHAGHGVWGAPTGRDVLIIAVSHYRLRQGVIVEDITVFDELAVLRQIAGGLGDGGGAP